MLKSWFDIDHTNFVPKEEIKGFGSFWKHQWRVITSAEGLHSRVYEPLVPFMFMVDVSQDRRR